jgi:ABC-type Fe3+ transport system permease subunit
MLGAIEIDVTALWHTVVIAFAGGLVAILAAGSVIVSLDRADGAQGARAAWFGTALLGAVVTVGVVAVGIWAMTQK